MLYKKVRGKWIINKRGTYFAATLEDLYELQAITMEIFRDEGCMEQSPMGKKIAELEFKIQQAETARREACTV